MKIKIDKLLFIILFFIVITFPLSSQNKTTILNHSNNHLELSIKFDKLNFTIEEKEGQKIIDFPDYANYNKNDYKIPYSLIYIAIPPQSEIAVKVKEKNVEAIENCRPIINPEVSLSNDSVLIYTKNKSNLVPNSTIQDFQILGYTYIRDYYCAIIKINNYQFYFDQNKFSIIHKIDLDINFKNIKSFSINNSPIGDFDKELKNVIVNYDFAKSFRTYRNFENNDTTGNWIQYDKNYVKLAVINDGIHRIHFSDLVSCGLNPLTIDPKTIKIFYRGMELPIFVFGEADNIFNQNDFIEFYGQRNYDSLNYRNIVNLGDDYINYMNRYTDTSYYFMTYGATYGKRVEVKNNIMPTSPDTLYQSWTKIHLETDERMWFYDATVPRTQLPFWQEHKVWTGKTIGKGSTISYAIPVNSIVPNTSTKLVARLISQGASTYENANSCGISINSTTPFDTLIFNYKKTVNLNSNFTSNKLIEGNNTIRIFGLPTAASFYQVLTDWIDLEYIRYNAAINDSISIKLADDVVNGYYTFKISNIKVIDTALILYKLSPTLKRIQNFTLSSGTTKTLTFNDSGKAGDQYLLVSFNYIKKPKFLANKYFTNLRNANNGADYILISNKALEPTLTNYKNFIIQQYNKRVKLVYVDDIYDEFSYGQMSAEGIKLFLKSAYQNWQPPKPSYLALIGDANWDYKDKQSPVPIERKKNIVPSFGNPVSDTWYTWFDSSYLNLQEMYVGRIPVNNNQELQNYLVKHQAYLEKPFDEFNKSYMLFSGGNPTYPDELAQIKATNDYIASNFINTYPIAGFQKHFYKTINPPTNFGPFTEAEIQETIGKGSLFISYIGHSGTRTWDNGISEVEHLKNKFSNRFPLMTDFGCSTGKFAEPDVDAFGELFIGQSSNGQAISYLGNTSLGYLSTSLSFPKIFYETLLRDSLSSFGNMHFKAKTNLISNYGLNDVNRVFLFCNILFGDPIITLAKPSLPNLNISNADFKLLNENPLDRDDSLAINIKFRNLGKAIYDTFYLEISDKVKDTLNYFLKRKCFIPGNDTSLVINVPIKNKTGQHNITVELNKNRSIIEITYNDNLAELNYTVYPSSILPIISDKFYGIKTDKLKLLNPFLRPEVNINSFNYSLSDNINFIIPINGTVFFDTIKSLIDISSLGMGKRYYWKVKLNEQNSEWSDIYSFQKSSKDLNWMIDSSLNFKDIDANFASFDSTTKSFKLIRRDVPIRIISAGSYEGAIAEFYYDGKNVIPNTFFWGVVGAILDSITFKPTLIKYFIYPNPPSADSLIAFINSVPNGTYIALSICDDGAQSCLGYSGGTPVRNVIKTLGSKYIDSVRYRESWCLLGRKGAAIGTVPEAYKKHFTGPAIIELSKSVLSDSGSIIFPQIANSTSWEKLYINKSIPQNSNLEIYPLGVRNDNSIDTLAKLDISTDSVSISNIDAKTYPKIKLLSKFTANPQKESPQIFSIGAKYSTLPELAINYQTVSLSRDTIYQGEKDTITFFFQNVGEVDADSVRTLVNVIRSNNLSFTLLDTLIFKISKEQKIFLQTVYRNIIQDGKDNFAFQIIIDPENKIDEFYKTNNSYLAKFFIKPDTHSTSVNTLNIKLKFNGVEIKENDFVDKNSNIEVAFNYPIWFPITDTSAIDFQIDGNKIDKKLVKLNLEDTINRNALFSFKPILEDGEHTIKIFGKNSAGKMETKPGFELNFQTTSELKIENVYNFPNPFSNETNFTLSSTQIPDNISIKIFTIAGRLIKEINQSTFQGNPNFISIFWDGKDNDGDEIGNGVYLYKVIIKKGDKTQTSIQKLVKVR